MSGGAISQNNAGIVLATAAVPAKRFNRNEALPVPSETGTEKKVEFQRLSMTVAGDKWVAKAVHMVGAAVRDLDSPRYKLYLESADLMRQSENHLNAWMGMQPAQQSANQ